MSKKRSCLDFSLNNLTQKIFDLSSNFCVALIYMKTTESRQLQIHIKLIEKETKRFICLDKVFWTELFRQLNQFENINIEYPCAATRDIGLSIKTTSNPGEYKLIFEKTKLVLDSITLKYLRMYEHTIWNEIRDIENLHIRGGYDVVG